MVLWKKPCSIAKQIPLFRTWNWTGVTITWTRTQTQTRHLLYGLGLGLEFCLAKLGLRLRYARWTRT